MMAAQVSFSSDATSDQLQAPFRRLQTGCPHTPPIPPRRSEAPPSGLKARTGAQTSQVGFLHGQPSPSGWGHRPEGGCLADGATAAADALAAIQNAGVTLRMEGHRLLASPRAAVTADLAALIAAHRDGLAALLTGGTPPESQISPVAGYVPWLAAKIGADLDRLPRPSSRDGARLLQTTHAFVATRLGVALAHGWSVGALFGVADATEHPAEIAATGGLVVWHALRWPSATLTEITPEAAALARAGGGRVWRGRFAAGDDLAPWWVSGLVGEDE